jgi:hypothetical protein
VLAVAVDVDDDIAVTVFLRRAHGGADWQTHLLARSDRGWRILGGGGWGLDDLDALTRVAGSTELGGPARADGAGGVAVSRPDLANSRARWLSYTMVRTSPDVHSLVVSGRRTIIRPAHGRIAVVWRGRQRLPATVLGGDGRPLCSMRL